ncbi:hypothetical protein ATE67_17720 [Sphingopyxis sp. H050]|jgi:hypothetical protein|uniref:DUF4402 domain-containing protein n=1 Tax=Sphingopyxis sp. H050 TaxID=1759072 RepID=UPI000736553C|nr:DUF4402 domain-containing protein [Sphingopyxis sp. H050]KTE18542.1 hypothetical protein ATE67_17720 [Sphingopyxis sp. H050]
MRNGLKRALVGAAIAALAMNASAAHAATATATAKARILQQLTLTNTSDLDFATVVSGTTASTVVVSTAGARTCGSGLTCIGTPGAAGFNLVGTSGALVGISGPSTATLTSGANNMTVGLTYSNTTVTLGTTNSFSVGGTLNVGANQAAGNYTGTFTVTADYQ